MYPDGDVDNIKCGQCKYFSHSGCTCKRIDHDIVRFAQPWFKSYDRNQHSGVVCSDFEPAARCISLCKTWKGFEYYWPRYVDQWLPDKNTDTYIGFVLHRDTNVRYHVKLLDYVFGTMIEDGRLKAFEKIFSKRGKNTDGGCKYNLIVEPIENGYVEL